MLKESETSPRTQKPDAPRRFAQQRTYFFVLVLGLFLVKGAALPGPGFGDLWFNTDVARGVGHRHLNLYQGVDEQLETRYQSLPPAFVAPYGPTYYYPIWALHRLSSAVGKEDPLSCAGECELERRPLWWGFLAKLPHILLDAGCAIGLVLLLPRRNGLRAALAWLASPGLFYVFYVMGQNDVFPLLTLLVGFGLLARRMNGATRSGQWSVRNAEVLSMIALGLGGSMKILPLFFAPGFAFVVARRPVRAVLLTAVAVGTMLLTAAPFLGSEYFLRSFLLSQRIIVLLTNDLVGLSPLVLTMLATIVLVRRSRFFGTVDGLLLVLIAISASISLFTDFNPQRGAYLSAAVAVLVGFRRLPTLVVLAASAPVLVHPLTSSALGPGVLAHLLPVYGQLPAPISVFGRAEYLVVARLLARSCAVLAAAVGIVAVASPSFAKRAGRTSPWLQPALGGLVTIALLISLTATFLLGQRGPEPALGGSSTGDLAGRTIRQAFPVIAGAGAVRIDVFLDPMNRVPPRSLRARLLDDCTENAHVIGSATTPGLVLFDASAQYVSFDFDRRIIAPATAACVELDFRDVAPGRGVAAFLTSKSGLGPASLDGVTAQGALAMRDRYDVPAGELVSAWRERLASEANVVLLSQMFALALGAGAAWFTWARTYGAARRPRNERMSS